MVNPLNSGNPRGVGAMAGLLLTAVLSAPLSGCLIPQDDQVNIDLPPKANSPLRIVANSPGQRVGFKNGTGCTNEAFTLTVEDADIADVVYSLWFIDPSPKAQAYQPNSLPGGSRAQRSVTAPNSAAFRSALADLSPGTHLLTVHVADTLFLEPIDGNVGVVSRDEVLLDGGIGLKDKGYIDSFTWVLDVEKCL
jgi:hypothetical protein